MGCCIPKPSDETKTPLEAKILLADLVVVGAKNVGKTTIFRHFVPLKTEESDEIGAQRLVGATS